MRGRASAVLEYAQRGLGFGEFDAPLINLPTGPIWLHFGGSAYQTLLCALIPSLHPAAWLVGLATRGYPDQAALGALAEREITLRQAVERYYEELEPALAPGRYQHELPEACRRQIVSNLLDLSMFRRWLETRHVWEVAREDPRWEHLQMALRREA